jgi:ATP-dependent RNA helicase DOB1
LLNKLAKNLNILQRGVGVHHAGLIPVFKAFVESLFNGGYIKVLFATETLAAGDPSKKKFNGILLAKSL